MRGCTCEETPFNFVPQLGRERRASHRTRAGKGRSLGEKTSEMTTGKQPAAMAEYLTSDATPVRVGAKEARSAKGVVRAHERAH